MSSALHGVEEVLRDAGRRPAAADEIGRLLDILDAHGWSGFISADAALMGLLAGREGNDDEG